MRKRTLILALAILSTATVVLSAEPSAKKSPPITILKETTYITELLLPNGYPDYAAAVNRIASEGVTPENNAFVLLVKAFGPALLKADPDDKYADRYSAEQQADFYKMLGITPPSEKENYFVLLEDYVKQHDPDALKDEDENGNWRPTPCYDEQSKSMNQPWSKEECPLIAGWLAENEKQLEIIIEASHRPRFYMPMVLHDQWLNGTYLGSGTFLKNNVVNALKSRAMQRVQQGKIKAAHEDLMACHRFARLQAQGGVEGLFCFNGYGTKRGLG